MFFSNWFALYLTIQAYEFDVPAVQKYSYIGLSTLVGVIRWAGFGIEINAIKVNGWPKNGLTVKSE
jgi:hypothetical protein